MAEHLDFGALAGVIPFAHAGATDDDHDFWPSEGLRAPYEHGLEGAERAEQLVEIMAARDTPDWIAPVVGEIIKKGVLGPTEMGFFMRLAELACDAVPRASLRKRPQLQLIEGGLND